MLTGNKKRRLQKLEYQRMKYRKWLKRKKGGNNKKTVAFERFHRVRQPASWVINFLEENKFGSTSLKRQKFVNMPIPETFCFIKNPEITIAFLKKLFAILNNPRVAEIHFNHGSCKHLGACASTVMDVLLMEGEAHRRALGIPIVLSGDLLPNGKISSDSEIDDFLKSSGILRHLDIEDEKNPNIESLELIEDGTSAEATGKIIEYLVKALERNGLKLSKDGVNYLGNLLGEITANCRHGGEGAKWYTLGHYCADEETKFGKCKLVIFNFGDTIFQSLNAGANKALLKKMENYLRKGRSRFSKAFSSETLLTLFALQQRISCVPQRFSGTPQKNDDVRGNGTVEFLDAFQNLFQTGNPEKKSKLSITSGACSILFDGTYKLKEQKFGDYTNRIIAFNDTNKLSDEPDTKYVRTLSNSFPGTVISMELFIDGKFLVS